MKRRIIALTATAALAALLLTGCAEAANFDGPAQEPAPVPVTGESAAAQDDAAPAATEAPAPAPAASETQAAGDTGAAAASESSAASSYTAPQSGTVYIAGSGKGKKYHSDPNCSNMNDPVPLTQAEAEARNYTPCKKCYG